MTIDVRRSKIWISRDSPSPRSLVSPPCLELNTPPDATFARLSKPNVDPARRRLTQRRLTQRLTQRLGLLRAMSPFLVSSFVPFLRG
ncbi:hypothetical protein I7I48_02964 [Histoplasma ohiense]|nr:hypothetical protein I7I48_02964 [Histoplasma ohiense (nom. inval.)]